MDAPAHTGLRLDHRPYRQSETPIFVKAGAIIPLRRPLSEDGAGDRNVVAAPDTLVFHVAAGVPGTSVASFQYDDGGDGSEYGLQDAYRLTHIRHNTTGTGTAETSPKTSTIEVFARAEGLGFEGELENRSYEIRWRCPAAALHKSKSARTEEGCTLPSTIQWDAGNGAYHVLKEVPPPPRTNGPQAPGHGRAKDPPHACWWREAEPNTAGRVLRVVAWLPNVEQRVPRWALKAM